MSILIKGMEMPKNCLECPFGIYKIVAGDNYCLFTKILCLGIGRQNYCPLVEVVQCKDCEFATPIKEAVGLYTCESGLMVGEKHYCSYGTKEEDLP